MSEALVVEHVYKRRYAEWQTDLAAGSAKAMCVLAWLIWRRDGRDVPFEDIIEGRAEFDLLEMLTSMAEAAEAERSAAEPDPTPPSAPAGTPGTGTDTPSPVFARESSATRRAVRESASSTSRTSRP